jgi:hypothetical protein
VPRRQTANDQSSTSRDQTDFYRRIAAVESATRLFWGLGTIAVVTIIAILGVAWWYVERRLLPNVSNTIDEIHGRIGRRVTADEFIDLHTTVHKLGARHDERLESLSVRVLRLEQQDLPDGSVWTDRNIPKFAASPEEPRPVAGMLWRGDVDKLVASRELAQRREVFYADMPDADRCFPADRLSREMGKYSLYEIHAGANAETGASAELALCRNPDAHQIAMADHRPFLMSACEYTDLPRGDQKRIEVTKAGRVTWQGDRWQVAEKIQIKFS